MKPLCSSKETDELLSAFIPIQTKQSFNGAC